MGKKQALSYTKVCQYSFVLVHVSRILLCVLFRIEINPLKSLQGSLDSLSALPQMSTCIGQQLKITSLSKEGQVKQSKICCIRQYKHCLCFSPALLSKPLLTWLNVSSWLRS